MRYQCWLGDTFGAHKLEDAEDGEVGVSLGTLPHAAKHAAREATNFGVKRVRSPESRMTIDA